MAPDHLALSTGWSKRHNAPWLEQNEVHLWLVQLALLADVPQDCLGWLTHSELRRAHTFHRTRDQRAHIYSRLALRSILSEYIQCHPAEVMFGYNSYGKPYLAASSNDSLRFNITHSNAYMLCAITTHREVGVDIERIDRSVPIQSMAQSYFSASELALLATFPAQQQEQLFFTMWVRKEAIVKAHGMGISLPLDSIEVAWPSSTTVPSAPTDVSWITGQWSVFDIPLNQEYVAAVAIQGVGCTIKPIVWQ